ncbi:ABC transporter permease [Patescibacteria group bacterium]|nr:ABC transporter permease [Patescibacteria group bacterium]MBU1673793.1 ABC transporter permease [Patescibacteria group bacterium]MBU1963820.1 ABC transporter permease [Patescibacteria group bacterium]
MLINENVKFAFSSLWGNKIRSVLTMLGVIIGVFSVITLVSIGEGLRNEFSTQVSDIGSNLIIVASGQIDTESESFNPASLLGNATLSVDDVDRLKEEVPNIEKMVWTINMPSQVSRDDKTLRSTINFATQPEVLEIMTYDLESGRDMTYGDMDAKARVVILGGQVKNSLFDEDEEAIDQKINLVNEEFTVIGVMEEKENAISFGDTNFNNVIILPFTTGEEIVEDSSIFRIILQADSPETVDTVATDVNNVILDQHDQNEDFSVLTQEDLLDLFESFFSILTSAITGIAAISLIVGGIGIMNIMLVSVTERTREIGIRKSIGATSTNILTQFLIEAGVISLIGGGIGVGLAFIASQLIAIYAGIPATITLQALLLGLLISMGVGIVFGLAPAIKAAQKRPIEALRYE